MYGTIEKTYGLLNKQSAFQIIFERISARFNDHDLTRCCQTG